MGRDIAGRAPVGAAGHETSDAYSRVLSVSGRWRVIRCREDRQFIVQKRAGRAKERPWQAVAFIVNAKALGPVLKRPSLGIPADDIAKLLDLERSGRWPDAPDAEAST